MTEFDKWWNNNGDNYCDEGGANYEECAEECWKAALGMVLKKFDGKTDMLTLGLDIAEELREE